MPVKSAMQAPQDLAMFVDIMTDGVAGQRLDYSSADCLQIER
jgi:hypothetical protein